MWIDILTEAALHQLLPLFAEITLPALRAFGEPVLPWPLLVALAGALLAAAMLYRLGGVIGARFKSKNPEEYAARCKRLSPYVLALLLFITTPLGFAICIAAGVFAAPLRLAVPLAFIGLCFVYGGTYGLS